MKSERQIELIESGGKVVQATRLYDPDKRRNPSKCVPRKIPTDYRYFPDPDLPPLVISAEWIERVKKELPELPEALRKRFINEYGLPEYDATVLTQSKAMAEYYEKLDFPHRKAAGKAKCQLADGRYRISLES